MDLAPIAAEYIRTHRADCTDAEIRKALKEQGFSDGVLDDAFEAAGARPPSPAPKRPFLRALVWGMYALAACLLVGAALLLVYNLSGAR